MVFLQNGYFLKYHYAPPGWTHIVMNYIGPNNGEGIRIYYNGVEEASVTAKGEGTYLAGDGRIVLGKNLHRQGPRLCEWAD